MKRHNKYKKQIERDQKTNKAFDNINRKSLQDNIVDKNEYEHPCKNFN